jgi:hypothetical protein
MLVPRLGPLPRGMPWVLVLALALAWVLCLPGSLHPSARIIGGVPDIPGLSHTVSQMAARGPGPWAHSRLIMYPSVHNLYSEMSFPMDGILAWPLVALLGWPGGFSAFSVLALAATGATTGFLAARWWRSLPAALAAVVVVETSGIVLREIAEGRLTHVVGLALTPPAIGWFCRAVVEDRGRWSFLAGAAVGFAALVFWYQAVWIALMLVAVFLAGAIERAPVVRHTMWGAAGAFAVAGFPLLYTVFHAGAHPGSQYGPWDIVEQIPGERVYLLTLLESRDIHWMGAKTGAWAVRPLLAATVLLGAWGAPRRRWAVPLAWIVVGWVLAEGPVLPIESLRIYSPVILQSLVPLARRYWWPDRYLLVAAVGSAILASGAFARGWRRPRALTGAAVAWTLLVLGEAWVALPSLPMPSTPGPDRDRVAALSTGTGPALVVPLRDLDPGATNKVWASEELLDQIAHGRPMLAGPMNPDSMVAGPLYRRFWENPALAAIRACETSPSLGVDAPTRAAIDTGFGALRRLGLREVYAEPTREGPDAVAAAWRGCLEELLGPPTGQAGSLRVYAVPEPSARAEPLGGPT